MANLIKEIIDSGNAGELLALFSFDEVDVTKLVLKFNLWSRYHFPQFFESPDAPFHKEIDENNAKAYLGIIDSFANLGFRGCAKTTRTKLFTAFVIANDLLHRRKYLKVLSQDGGNSKQFVTDVYNLLIDTRVKTLHPEIFEKTDTKREETMSSFTTATGVKLLADTVGSTQRGQIQDESRPDWVIFDDFETRQSLRSAVVTKSIWDNMEEARNGLAKNGVTLYLGNYLSERGNVHKIVAKQSETNVVLNIPIIKDGVPTWSARYSKEDIDKIKKNAEDFEGEYLGEPSKSKDVIFDRDKLDSMKWIEPIKEIAGQKIYKKYDPSHRYAAGADVAGGVGLDSSTSVFIDFSTIPAQVVATYANNEIKPDIFGDELCRQGERFGESLLAPEKNNHGHATIGRLKQIYPIEQIYETEAKEVRAIGTVGQQSREFGWETNGLTKPRMLFSLSKAIENGHLELNDKDLIAECRSYTRNDLMDAEVDVRLTTRHFDLLIACAIAWQMKDHAKEPELSPAFTQPSYEPSSEYEASGGRENTNQMQTMFVDLHNQGQ